MDTRAFYMTRASRLSASAAALALLSFSAPAFAFHTDDVHVVPFGPVAAQVGGIDGGNGGGKDDDGGDTVRDSSDSSTTLTSDFFLPRPMVQVLPQPRLPEPAPVGRRKIRATWAVGVFR